MLAPFFYKSLLVSCLILFSSSAQASEPPESSFRSRIEPLLQRYCSDCHADGANKGGVSFDEFNTQEELLQHDLWLKVLKNVRAGLMPPPRKKQPTDQEKALLEDWIKHTAFQIDPAHPDPGRVVVRRLNRVEYRNTVRDLIGVDFNTEGEFPPDDTGHGFDNIGSVLSLSPLLVEKYLDAAKTIISQTVPQVSGVPAEKFIPGQAFRSSSSRGGSLSLSYYEAATVSNRFNIAQPGRYELVLNLTAAERYVDNQFDYNRCLMTFTVDGEELLRREFSREGGKPFIFKYDRKWEAGDHEMVISVQPLTPGQEQIRSLNLRINSVIIRGPFDERFYVHPKDYQKYFPRPVPEDPKERRAYAAELLRRFAERAYRAPVDDHTVDRLVSLAESIYETPKQTFEAGISQAMVAILASPRFLFREERVAPGSTDDRYPLVDEYSLANRLSYFLWSSMPDDELFRHARNGSLRQNLSAQVKRMLADPKSEEFIRNFAGQWLHTRDMENVQINSRAVRARETSGDFRNASPAERRRFELDGDLRRAMRAETEAYFAHIVREDRNVLELIESDYTFLNERLAAHYDLDDLNIKGSDLRKVTLPPGSPRGGILTHGSVLTVTSNPTRTSPVKRGMFVLENILGTPPPPPPPDIPSLEDTEKDSKNRKLTLRESLEIHRNSPSCSSCHARMDPLGLALEHFNALGAYRSEELGQPIDASGKLISGESFNDVRELKKILVSQHAKRFFETLSEKLLTYALGRGLEYYDIEAVDQIAEKLEKEQGRFSAALLGVIESAPFQRTRPVTDRLGNAHAQVRTKP